MHSFMHSFFHSFIHSLHLYSVSSRDLLGGAILTLKLVWLYIEKLLQIEPKFIKKDLFIIRMTSETWVHKMLQPQNVFRIKKSCWFNSSKLSQTLKLF